MTTTRYTTESFSDAILTMAAASPEVLHLSIAYWIQLGAIAARASGELTQEQDAHAVLVLGAIATLNATERHNGERYSRLLNAVLAGEQIV